MTLVVHAGLYRQTVIRHLARLVPAELWTIDEFGFVDLIDGVPPTLARPAVRAIQAITGVNGLVEIFGSEAAAVVVVNGRTQKIGDVGGAAFIDPTSLGPDARVPVIYDSTDNYGNGYWVRGADGTQIDFPPHIILGHELAHAIDALEATYTQAKAETSAIAMENALRVADDPPLPVRGTHEGGKKSKPQSMPNPTAPSRKGGCFIATAVVEAEGGVGQLDELRRFRDTRVRATVRGKALMDAFYEGYGDVGARIAAHLGDVPVERKSLWLLLVGPVLSYLTLAVDAPEQPLDAAELPAPWSAFAAELQDGLQCWALSAMPPLIDAPADDADFVARYVLRSPEARQALARSRATGQGSAALLQLVSDAQHRFSRTVEAFQGEDEPAGVLPDGCDPVVAAVAAVVRRTAGRELRELRHAFEAVGQLSVYDIAFIGPLAHFMRLAALLPSGSLPDELPPSWRTAIERLREDIDALLPRAMAAVMARLDAPSPTAPTPAQIAATAPTVRASAGFGNDIGTLLDAISWRYTVTLRNADTDNATYVNLRVYYLAKPGGPQDMGLVTLPNLLPGEVAVFPLCECSRLMSYYIKGDLVLPDGSTGEFTFPDEGSMTAQRANDPHACEDSWAF